MQCPTCSATMKLFRHEAAELDVCIQCGTLWFDQGELSGCLEFDLQHVRPLSTIEQAPPSKTWIPDNPPTRTVCPQCGQRTIAECLAYDVPLHRCLGNCGLYLSGDSVGELRERVFVPVEDRPGPLIGGFADLLTAALSWLAEIPGRHKRTSDPE